MITKQELKTFRKLEKYEGCLYFALIACSFKIDSRVYRPKIRLEHLIGEDVEYLAIIIDNFLKSQLEDGVGLDSSIIFLQHDAINDAILLRKTIKKNKDYSFWEKTYNEFISRLQQKHWNSIPKSVKTNQALQSFYLTTYPNLKDLKNYFSHNITYETYKRNTET